MSRTYRLVVWWGTSVEATSRFHRLKREGKLTTAEVTQAIDRLNHLRAKWDETEPSEAVREMAERLLARHKLRAADALELRVTLDWCENHPRGRAFVGRDGDLLNAAEVEGITYIRIM